MMHPYGGISVPQTQQTQQLHQVSRPSPPNSTWAVPPMHNTYYQVQRGAVATSREESERLAAKSDVSASNSPALSTATFRNAHDGLGTTDYFPGVIDTSMYSDLIKAFLG